MELRNKNRQLILQNKESETNLMMASDLLHKESINEWGDYGESMEEGKGSVIELGNILERATPSRSLPTPPIMEQRESYLNPLSSSSDNEEIARFQTSQSFEVPKIHLIEERVRNRDGKKDKGVSEVIDLCEERDGSSVKTDPEMDDSIGESDSDSDRSSVKSSNSGWKLQHPRSIDTTSNNSMVGHNENELRMTEKRPINRNNNNSSVITDKGNLYGGISSSSNIGERESLTPKRFDQPNNNIYDIQEENKGELEKKEQIDNVGGIRSTIHLFENKLEEVSNVAQSCEVDSSEEFGSAHINTLQVN